MRLGLDHGLVYRGPEPSKNLHFYFCNAFTIADLPVKCGFGLYIVGTIKA